MTGPTPSEELVGTTTFTRQVPAWYDVFVLGVVYPLVWGCPKSEMIRWYDRHVGARHLELGPGSGYFLDRCRFPVARPELALVDLNESVLHRAAARVRRYRPAEYRRDVLTPLDLPEPPFDSAGINGMLHSLPGGMAGTTAVFDHVRRCVRPGGVIFGSTVLAEGVPHSRLAPPALESLNKDRTFCNEGDSLDGLRAQLAARFDRFRLATRGSVAFFVATV